MIRYDGGATPTTFTIGGARGCLYKNMGKLRLAAVLLLLTCAVQGWAAGAQSNGDFRLCDNATQSPAEAIPACTRILNLKPAGAYFPMAWSNRGAAWFTKGDLDKAIADFSEAIKTNPKLIVPYRNRAAAWLLEHEFERAVSDYAAVIRLEPEVRLSLYRSRKRIGKNGRSGQRHRRP